MKITVTEEAGFESALKGLALSYYKKDKPFEDHFQAVREKMVKQTKVLNRKALEEGNYSHSKVLRQICVWAMIDAPRSFWSQFDTYTVGVVRQSASTMHTLAKQQLNRSDFSEHTSLETIESFMKLHSETKDINVLRDNLPEGFMQMRMVWFNYASLQNIIMQRKHHRYGAWVDFIEQLKPQLAHSDLILW